MQKFKHFKQQSRFKKYAVNAPNKNRAQEKIVSYDLIKSDRRTHEKNTNDHFRSENSVILQLQSKGSIRSSVERVKSGKIERSEIINRQMTKSTIKKMKRYNTQQRDFSYQLHTSTLKKYVNGLNITCNQVIKASEGGKDDISRYCQEQRKKFLMGQISFTQIDEQKVQSQKKYLSKFQHLTKSLPKMFAADFVPQQIIKDTQWGIIQCLRAIDRIYSVIKDMEIAGYLHKSNKFVIDYCTNGRVWLRRVFLKESSDKKDAFSMVVKYYVTNMEEAKRKFTEFIAKSQNQNMVIIQKEVQGLFEHLQHTLTQKKISRLMNVTDEISSRIKKEDKTLKSSLRYSETIENRLRLTQDLQTLEAQFGPMREISKVSRRRFQQLNKTYDKLQNYL